MIASREQPGWSGGIRGFNLKSLDQFLHKLGNIFLVDAVFNRGYSGGIVLAIRDGVPNFELVGLVKSVPAEYEYVMKPIMTNNQEL